MKQRVIISKNLEAELAYAISQCHHDRIFILTDDITINKCWNIIKDYECLKGMHVITIKSSDINKTIDSVASVWEELSNNGATRHSCLINLGGGMVTDLGGFAASTFKRGMDFINIPTTLLAIIDASVGGKTGFNFNGLKNEIGVFSDSNFVILSTIFLQTLDMQNICSGYAEMLKHGLISDVGTWARLVSFNLSCPDMKELGTMIADNVKIKERIVETDHQERGIRKALNLGHTIGHAFESLAMNGKRPILHGYAVAYGLICELYLCVIKAGFPADKMRQTVNFIKEHYGTFTITCNDYEALYELMLHDKKNKNGIISFTLLKNIGEVLIDQTATKEEIFEAFDFYREG